MEISHGGLSLLSLWDDFVACNCIRSNTAVFEIGGIVTIPLYVLAVYVVTMSYYNVADIQLHCGLAFVAQTFGRVVVERIDGRCSLTRICLYRNSAWFYCHQRNNIHYGTWTGRNLTKGSFTTSISFLNILGDGYRISPMRVRTPNGEFKMAYVQQSSTRTLKPNGSPL